MSCGYFPHLYEDELFYSACARCLKRMGVISSQRNIYSLFGVKSKSIAFYALDLDTFIASLPTNYKLTADEIIEKHTLFPWHAPFLSKQRQEVVRLQMHGKGGQSLYSSIGMRNSKVKLDLNLRYCSDCVKEDRQEYGEAYWHRVHQIPGITICPYHLLPLQVSTARVTNGGAYYSYTAVEDVFVDNIKSNDEMVSPDDLRLLLAQDAEWLLKFPLPDINAELVVKQLVNALYDQDLASINGVVYREKFLDHLSVNTSKIPDHDPLQVVLQFNRLTISRIFTKRPHSLLPITVILLCRLLGFSFYEVLNSKKSKGHFQVGLLGCQNKICPKNSINSISELTVQFSRAVRGLIGTYRCGVCGCVFRKTIGSSNRRSVRIIDYGELWETELRSLWSDDKYRLKDVSERLKVDIRTIKNNAARLGLGGRKLPSPKVKVLLLPAITQTSIFTDQRKKNREAFLNIITNNPGITRSQIAKLASKTYQWLMRNDHDWIVAHNVPRVFSSRSKDNSSYWQKRENDLICQLPEKVERIRSKPGKPERVTKSAIEREYEHISLTPAFLIKVPNFKTKLDSVIESRVEFGIRMIDWAYLELSQSSSCIPKWMLIKTAGVKSLADHVDIQVKLNSYFVK